LLAKKNDFQRFTLGVMKHPGIIRQSIKTQNKTAPINDRFLSLTFLTLPD